jgi:UDP-N-acetylmuramate: L-alanyl-gamma-D-glutamyl-meso-diaminopimelate ligase
MKLHILGICGTFMGGIAALARELGHEVDGSDANVYPPMSDQLQALGIRLKSGYQPRIWLPIPNESSWAMPCRAATR